MKLLKLIFPILIIAIIGACSNLFNKNDTAQPTLNFEANTVEGHTTIFNSDTLVFRPLDTSEPYPETNPPFISSVRQEQINIEGYFMSPCINWEPKGEISKKENKITIKIEPAKEPTCATMPSGVIYEARISNIAKGSYLVKIIHTNDILRPKSTTNKAVFEEQFTIE